MAHILVIGELNADFIASGLTQPPTLGREILAADFQLVLGSASAIFAGGVARLGHKVRFVSRVGDDYLGRFCLGELRRRGIATRYVTRAAEARTGVTVVLSTAQDRALVTHLGAIAELSAESLPRSIWRGCQHLHLTSYFLQERLRPDFPALMTLARRHGLTISFDPNGDPAQVWPAEIWEAAALSDIFLLNETEALQLTRQPDEDRALSALAGRVACAVIKLGPRGAIAQRGRERVAVKGCAVEVQDTTGAGDSFAAGFVHAFKNELTLGECLAYGNACGALSTRHAGGTAGQPDAAQLQNFLNAMTPRRNDATDNV